MYVRVHPTIILSNVQAATHQAMEGSDKDLQINIPKEEWSQILIARSSFIVSTNYKANCIKITIWWHWFPWKTGS